MVAYDLGQPESRSSTPYPFVIRVSRNNQPPQFINEPYSKDLLLTSPIGTFVYKVTAEDKDLVSNTVLNLYF